MRTTTDTTKTAARMTEVPLWLHRSTAWAWRVALLVASVIAAGWLLLRLRVVMVPVLAALMLASVLGPVVRALHRKGVPLLISTWIVLLSVGLVLGGVLAAVGWGLTSELTGEGERWDEIGADVRTWLRDGPLDLSEENVDQLERSTRRAVVGGAGSLNMDRARLLLEIVGGLFLTMALTFFFVKDGREMWSWVIRRVDPARREALDCAGRSAIRTLAAYLKAIAITGVVDAVVIGVGLWAIGVPLVIPLAIFTFFGAFLPVVGATIAGALAATVALVTNGPGDALLVVLLTLAVQQLEGDLIMPVVMGRQVPLHPAVVLAALAAGGALAGILGAFVAVPLAAVVTAAVGEFRSALRNAPVGQT